MDRRKKREASWVALILSIVSLLTLIALSSATASLDGNPVVGLTVIISTSIFLIAIIGIFAYSGSEWEVRGSTLEWLLAAIISPFTALLLYLIGGERRRHG